MVGIILNPESIVHPPDFVSPNGASQRELPRPNSSVALWVEDPARAEGH